MRFFTIVTLLVVLLLSTCLLASAQVSLEKQVSVEVLAPKSTGDVGSTFDARILINPNDIKVAGVQLDFLYDSEQLQLMEVTPGDLFEKIQTFYSEGKHNVVTGFIDDIYSFVVEPGAFAPRSGIFINIKFQILQLGKTSFTLDNIIVGDTKGSSLKVSSVNASLLLGVVTANTTVIRYEPEMIGSVTDEKVVTVLIDQGRKVDDVGLVRDYGEAGDDGIYGVDFSLASSQVYYDTKTKESIAIFGQLPMVDSNNDKVEVSWEYTGSYYRSKENLFISTVVGTNVSFVSEDNRSDGIKDGDTLTFSPQLFLGGKEVLPVSAEPTLLAIDPFNENYSNNVLEWDYTICKRYLRLIEGKVHGFWSFDTIPKDDITIKYNQSGSFYLALGRFSTDYDTEFVPVKAFESLQDFGSGPPYMINDSLTFYGNVTDAAIQVRSAVYATAHSATEGYHLYDASDLDLRIYQGRTGGGDYYIVRSFMYFDTSALPDSSTITGATFSIRCQTNNEAHVSYGDACLYEGTQGGPPLDIDDPEEFGSTQLTDGTWSWEYPLSTGSYDVATMNAAGLTTISKTSTSKYCLRSIGDKLSYGTYSNSQVDGPIIWSADKGVGYIPRLVVTYEEGAAYVPRMSGAHGGPG